MLIFDQLKKDDPQLRFLAVTVFGGLFILLVGLWWVQVVSAQHYQEKLEVQSLRTVRIPAVRGAILDRDGRPLAENRPRYNIDLYLEDLSKNFQTAYSNSAWEIKRQNAARIAEAEKAAKRKLTPQEKKQYALTSQMSAELARQTRYRTSSNIVADLSARLQENIALDPTNFQRQYERARALPLPVLYNLNSAQVARFEEQSIHTPGLDLDVQSLRYYSNNAVAAHVLGYLVHNNDSSYGEQSEYSYRPDDFVGVSGIEGAYDKELRGMGGGKSVVVNNLGYRQGETIWSPAEPGKNIVLTLDVDIQRAAEVALQQAQFEVRGAVVVMDARNGDVLAMASAPTFNPNHFIQKPDPATRAIEQARWTSEELKLQLNRAMQENYAPGSIFKIVVGLAALEQNAFDPKQLFHSLGYYPMPGLRHPIGDTAGPGEFDFDHALARSSNPYFIHLGLQPTVLPKIIALGQRLHLGERTGIMPRQEAAGHFPTPRETSASDWYQVETAYLSIGQGKIAVTPLQMAVMASAVANGGKVFWPRLVSRIESYDGADPAQTFPEGRLRDNLGVSQKSLRIVHNAMLADVENADGTGHAAFIPGFRIAGKTGTAQVEKNGHIDKSIQNTWFASFAPFENPRYAVVILVEGGSSGGGTCAPIAHKIYLAIQQREAQRERQPAARPQTLATVH